MDFIHYGEACASVVPMGKRRKYHLFKQFIVMKLIVLFLMICANASAIDAQQIELNFKNAPLRKVMQEIRKQAGYSFAANATVIDQALPVTVSIESASLENVLQTIFANQPLTYIIQGKIINLELKKSQVEYNRNVNSDLTGIIVDSMGHPLSGADVMVQGQSNKRTSTDINGRFTLRGVADAGVLIVRLIGFETTKMNYSGSSVTVSLKQATSDLDEVRVIAYGITSKRLTTGNISGINAAQIEKSPVNNPLLALSGRAPGIFINQASGLSGTALKINIQGINSITKGNDPFYVVDGVPYTAQLLPTLNSVLGGPGFNGSESIGSGNPFSYINPADIESIEVLKDADATAIYGSGAANGAILITTKKGKAGKTKIDLTLQRGAGKVNRNFKMLNTKQYLEMRREAYENDGLAAPVSTDAADPSNYDFTVYDLNRYTDWQKQLLGGTANYTDIQASISGGSSQTSFRLNGGFHKETTVFPGDFSNVKGSVGVSLNHTSTDNKFHLQFAGNYLNNNNLLPSKDLTDDALKLAPNAPALYRPDGSLNWESIEVNPSTHDSTSTFLNPLAPLRNVYKVNARNLIANTNISYELAKGLTVKASVGYTDMNTKELATFPPASTPPEALRTFHRTADYSTGNINSWIIEPQLSYNFNLGKGHADFLLGTTFQETDKTLLKIHGYDYSSDQAMNDYSSAAMISSYPSLDTKYKYTAVFARLNYNWLNKYIINLTSRRDGSSRFGAANRFHNFGSIGAAWLFSNEDFISDNLSFLSFGKLRASYGSTGNDQIGDYNYLERYAQIPGFIVPNPYQGVPGLEPTYLTNRYLQWELTRKFQIGLDLGFLNDRLVLGANYYKNRSSNQLINYTLPIQTGFESIVRNLPATVQNTGLEMTLTSNNVKNRKFSWNTSLNLTISRNKLIAFPNLSTSTYSDYYVIGQPIDIVKVFRFAGVDPQKGTSQFYTADGKITDQPDYVTDRTYIFKPSPRFYGGIQNSLSYKGFDLDFLFQFVKQEAPNFKLGSTFFLGGIIWNEPVGVLNRWQKPGDITDIQKFSVGTLTDYAGGSSLVFSDASYIRLKNISLSYTLPAHYTAKAKLERCRVFVQSQNLFTITKYAGLDPENASSSSLPPLRVITFGLQISL
jgi:TonB-dependent starch-binding outer membrane protein SusC